MPPVDPQAVISHALGQYRVLPTPPYPQELPPDLAPWHCYTVDGGHSIIIAVMSYHTPEAEPDDFLCPAPVRAVLRLGWTVNPEGYVVCDVAYDDVIGMITDPDDDEFDSPRPSGYEP